MRYMKSLFIVIPVGDFFSGSEEIWPSTVDLLPTDQEFVDHITVMS